MLAETLVESHVSHIHIISNASLYRISCNPANLFFKLLALKLKHFNNLFSYITLFTTLSEFTIELDPVVKQLCDVGNSFLLSTVSEVPLSLYQMTSQVN